LVVGARAFDVVKDMNHLADLNRLQYPDRAFLVVLVTHDDVIRSVAQIFMGATRDAHGYFPTYAETLPIHIEGNLAQIEFKGKLYNKNT